MGLLAGVIPGHARARLVSVSVGDGSPATETGVVFHMRPARARYDRTVAAVDREAR